MESQLCIERIEAKEELNGITEINLDQIKGYFFGKPCDFASFFKEYVEV